MGQAEDKEREEKSGEREVADDGSVTGDGGGGDMGLLPTSFTDSSFGPAC
ncbi:hypothetical protein HanPI659440_Chr14g0545571 [Helianthus annuus]|nr:hypothetical protein HanPI659440_Chr14g0545571 [Helianthus annuus]